MTVGERPPRVALALRSDRSTPDTECAPPSWGDVHSDSYRRRVGSLGSPAVRLSTAVDRTGRALVLFSDRTRVWTAEHGDVAQPARAVGDGATLTGACRVSALGVDRLWITARQHGEPLGLLVSERPSGTTRWSSPRLLLECGEDAAVVDVASPSVLRDGAGWMVWYAAFDGRTWGIRAARSRDGSSCEELGTALEPGADGDGDCDGALAPCVRRVKDGIVMVYAAEPADALHVATSPDGLTWSKRGPALFRGAPDRPDEAAAADPVLVPAAVSGRTALVYVGIDAKGRRSLMRIDEFLTPDGLPERAPTVVSTAELRRVLHAIPPEAMRVQLKPEKDAPPFVDADNGIAQVPGSSTPVFVIEHPSGSSVVKLGRAPSFVEREFDRATVMGRYMPTPPTDLRYVDGRPVLVSVHIPGPSLAELAREDPSRFLQGLERVLTDSLAMWSETCRPYDPRLVEFTPRTPVRLMRALRAMTDGTFPALSAPVVVNGEEIGISLAGVATAALPAIAEPPAWLVFANGDVNGLNHFLVSADGLPLAIDLEYCGWFDLDFAAAALYISVLHRGRAFRDVSLRATEGSWEIAYRLANPHLEEILRAEAFLRMWAQLPVRLERVCAYTLGMLSELRRLYGPPRDEARWLDGLAQAGAALTLFERKGVLSALKRSGRTRVGL